METRRELNADVDIADLADLADVDVVSDVDGLLTLLVSSV